MSRMASGMDGQGRRGPDGDDRAACPFPHCRATTVKSKLHRHLRNMHRMLKKGKYHNFPRFPPPDELMLLRERESASGWPGTEAITR